MKYYFLLYLAMILGAGAQVMLKVGSRRLHGDCGFFRRYLDPYFVAGLAVMVVATLLNVKGLRHVPLKDMAFILPTIYVMTPIFAHLFLGERLGRRTLIGFVLVVVGVRIFNAAP